MEGTQAIEKVAIPNFVEKKADDATTPAVQVPAQVAEAPVLFRVYKRRWIGLVALVLNNIVGSFAWAFFGPNSSKAVEQLGYTLDQVNWLANIMTFVAMPVSLLVPYLNKKTGLQQSILVGCIALVVSAWIRYCGTIRSLTPSQSYALVIVSQFIAAFAQQIGVVIGPRFSETWFGVEERGTATTLIALANPVGQAICQLVFPRFNDLRRAILVLAIISTAVTPVVFLIGMAPPTPPTLAGSTKSKGLISLLRALVGKTVAPEAFMNKRERFDFAILLFLFGLLASMASTFTALSGQYMIPYGYSSTTTGLMGTTLLLTGLVAAIAAAPLFDRVFQNHLAAASKVLVPVFSACWFSLIWAVRPNNTAALFVVMTIIGVSGLILMPICIELCCEVTRNAESSAGMLQVVQCAWEILFIQTQGALRAGPDANPPFNMHNGLIFNGVFVFAGSGLIFFLDGKQARREKDVEARALAEQGLHP